MPDSSYEDARRCPICEQPGKDVGIQKTIRGGKTLHKFNCMNSRCRWFGKDGWLVQINADGTIPPPEKNRQKLAPLPPRSQEEIDRQMNALLNQQLS